MKTFQTLMEELSKQSSTNDIAKTLMSYRDEKEILNPEFVRIKSQVSKQYDKDVRDIQAKILGTSKPGVPLVDTLRDVYYDMPSSPTSFTKVAKGLAAYEKAGGDRVLVDHIRNFIDVWTRIAADLKDLKNKTVKVGTKRAETKAAETKKTETGRKDSKSMIELLEKHRKEYIQQTLSKAAEFISRSLESLKGVDWDLDKLLTRGETERKKLYTVITSAVNPSRKPSDPNIRVANQKGIDSYMKQTEQLAGDSYDGFIAKMVQKVGKPVVSARMSGSIWTNAKLEVTTDDSEEQVWNTRVIINFSKYQKVFNQFPTRRVK